VPIPRTAWIVPALHLLGQPAGGRSPVVTRSFTARTVAPETFINVPTPKRQARWNQLSRNGQDVASGIYLCPIEARGSRRAAGS